MADKKMIAHIAVTDIEEPPSRQTLNPGDSLNTLFGKIKKVISDLTAVAFSGSYTDLKDRPTDILTGGSQTATSDADGGINAFTFTKADGTTAEFVVKNGSKGEKGDPGRDGVNATTTAIASEYASGLMDAAMVAKLNGIAEGANVVIHTSQLVNDSGYITAASIPGSLPANGGNADTVNGWHAMDIFSHRGLSHASVADPNVGGAWSINLTGVNFTGDWLNVVQFEEGHFAMQFGMNTSSTKLYVRTRYSGGGGGWAGWEDGWRDVTNADTVGGLPPYQLGTLNPDGLFYGAVYQLYCKFNTFGDARFALHVDGYETRVNYATNADYATSANVATYASETANLNPGSPTLKNLAVGTADPSIYTCPSGGWYGQYS